MREIVTHTETIQKEEVVSLTCDCCGKVVDGEHAEYASDIETWTHSFGYGSVNDNSTWTLDVCDSCIITWTNSFMHPIKFN